MKAQEFVVNGEVVGNNFDAYLEGYEFPEGYICVGVRTIRDEYTATMVRPDESVFLHRLFPETVVVDSIDEVMEYEGVTWQ